MKTFRSAFFLAYKTITQGNKSTAILLVCILSFSFLNILFITGILGGLGSSITEGVRTTATGDIQVRPQEEPTKKDFIENQDIVRAQIETIPGVTATVRRYSVNGSFAYDKEKDGKYTYVSANVNGIDIDEESGVFKTAETIIEGRMFNPLRKDEIVLGSGLAGGGSGPSDRDLGGVTIGDKVLVTFSSGTRTYTVVGISESGLGPANSQAFVSTQEAESILGTFNAASSISLKMNEEKIEINELRDRLQSLFPTLEIKSYIELLADIGTLLNAFNLIGIFVSVISIAVATVTIFVLVYVNAINKKRQIGILRAIGITPSIIVYSYILQSLFYAVCGIAVGSILVFGIVQPYLNVHPIQLPFGGTSLVLTQFQISYSVLALMIAGFLGGLVPSRIVTKESILQAIWG